MLEGGAGAKGFQLAEIIVGIGNSRVGFFPLQDSHREIDHRLVPFLGVPDGFCGRPGAPDVPSSTPETPGRAGNLERVQLIKPYDSSKRAPGCCPTVDVSWRSQRFGPEVPSLWQKYGEIGHRHRTRCRARA